MKFQTFNFARENVGKKQIDLLREQYAEIRDAALDAGIEDFDQRVRQMAKGPTKPSPKEYVQIARRVYDSAMRSGEGKASRQTYGGHPRAVPSDKMLREQARDRKLGLDNPSKCRYCGKSIRPDKLYDHVEYNHPEVNLGAMTRALGDEARFIRSEAERHKPYDFPRERKMPYDPYSGGFGD